MRKVLIITHDFPPLGGGAVLRAQKFAKYLPQFGWLPIIVTADIPVSVEDKSLLDELDSRIKIFRVPSPEKFGIERGLDNKASAGNIVKRKLFSNFFIIWRLLKNRILLNFFIPDRYMFWIPFAYKKCRQIIREEKIDVIYTSSPPISAHFIGYLLKRATKLPWVMDCRDLWLNHIIFAPKTFFGKLIGRRLERKFIFLADKVISATPPITEDFIYRYGRNEKFITITNGYDKEVFDCCHESSYQQDTLRYKTKDKFTIVYTGSLSNYQTPEYFLKAVVELFTEYSELRDNFEIIFAGGIQQDYVAFPAIKFVGFLPYKESVNLICSADVLLLIIYESGISNSILTGKIFDYIGACKPILALIPSGAASDLIKNEKLGLVVSPKDIAGIKRSIFEFYNKWREKKLYTEADYDKLSKSFDRKELTYKLSKILNEV